MPFVAYMSDGQKDVWTGVNSPFFKALIHDILNFFETGEVSFDTKQTLAVMALCEMAIKAQASPCSWIEA